MRCLLMAVAAFFVGGTIGALAMALVAAGAEADAHLDAKDDT